MDVVTIGLTAVAAIGFLAFCLLMILISEYPSLFGMAGNDLSGSANPGSHVCGISGEPKMKKHSSSGVRQAKSAEATPAKAGEAST
jgi:hypothetical protein